MKLPELSKDQSRIVEPYLLQALKYRNLAVVNVPIIYFEMIEDWEVILVLSQIVNWYLYEYKGEFCKTDAEMIKFFKIKNMTKWERLKRKLKKLPFLVIESRGMPQKTYYNVNYTKLLEEIEL